MEGHILDGGARVFQHAKAVSPVVMGREEGGKKFGVSQEKTGVRAVIREKTVSGSNPSN